LSPLLYEGIIPWNKFISEESFSPSKELLKGILTGIIIKEYSFKDIKLY